VPLRNPVPTDPSSELAKGRVALWLDPQDLWYLAGHCCCPKGADTQTRERCGRLRFRANAALHKSGLKPPDASLIDLMLDSGAARPPSPEPDPRCDPRSLEGHFPRIYGTMGPAPEGLLVCKPGFVLRFCGVQDEDILVTVNSMPMRSYDHLIEVLDESKETTVTLLRRGHPFTITSPAQER
jgi:hypothetical protein